GREREAVHAVLQPGRAALIGEARGVVAARILKALVLARAGLRVGGGGVDRWHDRAGAGVRGLASMDGAGARAPCLGAGFGRIAMVRHGMGSWGKRTGDSITRPPLGRRQGRPFRLAITTA